MGVTPKGQKIKIGDSLAIRVNNKGQEMSKLIITSKTALEIKDIAKVLASAASIEQSEFFNLFFKYLTEACKDRDDVLNYQLIDIWKYLNKYTLENMQFIIDCNNGE